MQVVLPTTARIDICYPQSMDLRNPCRDPVQTLNPWFVVQTMDWQRNPGIACVQSINQDNPGIAQISDRKHRSVICTMGIKRLIYNYIINQ